MIRTIEFALMRETIAQPAESTVHPRNGIGRGYRLRPVCQAWGGPRALKRRWSKEAGSTADTDHGNA